MYDVLIIGGGVVGCSLLYELSHLNLACALLEKENDVGMGATKANSAILHAGFDCEPGTLKAALNVKGVKLIREICKRLNVKWRDLPTLVLAFTKQDLLTLSELKHRAEENGVEGVRIISREEALSIEKNVNPEILGALLAPRSGIVDPWDLTIAQAEVAVKNGAEVHLLSQVVSIARKGDHFEVSTQDGQKYLSRYVVNAAGASAHTIERMVGGTTITPKHSAGQYFVLDKQEAGIVNSVVFPCPTEKGKGILVAPTVHGNLIVGPDAFSVDDPDSTAVVQPGLSLVKEGGLKSVPGIDFSQVIHEYCGVRPNTTSPDFIIAESDKAPGFINVAGIRSPGLSSAPAIADYVFSILRKAGLNSTPKSDFNDTRPRVRFKELSQEEKERLVCQNPLYARVICRCETITEGEIVDAIHSHVPPLSIDAIKRRVGAGLGRCQGGFCSNKVHSILSRELNRPLCDIPMDKIGSYITLGESHKGGQCENS